MSMAIGNVLVQRWGRPTRPLVFAGWQLTAGGVLLLPIALVAEGPPGDLTGSNLFGYAYLATAGGAVAYTLWFRGITALGARNVTFLGLLSPTVATAIGVATGDPFGPAQLVGGLVVLASVTAVQLLPSRPRIERVRPHNAPDRSQPTQPITCPARPTSLTVATAVTRINT